MTEQTDTERSAIEQGDIGGPDLISAGPRVRAQERAEHSYAGAVEALIRAARAVDDLLEPYKTRGGNWQLSGATNGVRHRVPLHDGSPAALALLILHDCLNDVDQARS